MTNESRVFERPLAHIISTYQLDYNVFNRYSSASSCVLPFATR